MGLTGKVNGVTVLSDTEHNNQLVHCKNSFSFKVVFDGAEFGMLNADARWAVNS